MLTLQKLKGMQPGTILAEGTTLDPRLYSKVVRWVAVRGEIPDWAIYYHLHTFSTDFVMRSGDKCFTHGVIKELVPCDDEAFAKYRF